MRETTPEPCQDYYVGMEMTLLDGIMEKVVSPLTPPPLEYWVVVLVKNRILNTWMRPVLDLRN